MIYIGKYKELCKNPEYPSIKDFFEKNPYPGKDKVVFYLKHGNIDLARMERARDVITGELINMEMLGMNDGEFTWFNTLAYYVEKYNLRLPREFENKIVN